MLPHTYGAWFARFPDLTQVQKAAIPAILAGGDVLVCSATASGKTEAYAAPAAEIALERGKNPGSVIIVSPTRALANDLTRRLTSPMRRVGLSLGRFTGEHKEREDGQLPVITITTPEGLDSILARRPHYVRQTSMVIVDEVHVLDNSTRGDQLRILLHRLQSCAEHRPQRIAVSATVEDPSSVASRYLEHATVINIPGGRTLKCKIFSGIEREDILSHLNKLAQAGLKKVLVFCQSRNQVEDLASACRPSDNDNRPTRYENRIFAHHGSMAKNRRERTERLFLESGSGVCFATMTLEMGIDIGTVDYVLLVGIPSSVSSLMQRIGRGGRRSGATRMGYAVKSLDQAYVLEQMLKLGKAGIYCERPYTFRSSVLVQQICVLAGSQAYLVPEDVHQILPPDLRQGLNPDLCTKLLASMVQTGYLEAHANQRYVLSDRYEQHYKRGTIHSNIDDRKEFEVVDRLSGETIGTVGNPNTRTIAIAGKDRKVIAHKGTRILTDATKKGEGAKYQSSKSPMVSLALARKVVESLGVPPNKIGYLQQKGGTYLLHGLGTFGWQVATSILEDLTKATICASGPFVSLLTKLPTPPPTLTPDQQTKALTHLQNSAKAYIGLGPWSKALPEDLLTPILQTGSGITQIATYLHPNTFTELKAIPDHHLEVILRMPRLTRRP